MRQAQKVSECSVCPNGNKLDFIPMILLSVQSCIQASSERRISNDWILLEKISTRLSGGVGENQGGQAHHHQGLYYLVKPCRRNLALEAAVWHFCLSHVSRGDMTGHLNVAKDSNSKIDSNDKILFCIISNSFQSWDWKNCVYGCMYVFILRKTSKRSPTIFDLQDDKGNTSKLIADTVALFITAMDKLRLDIR